MTTNASLVATMLRDTDNERYLATLVIPEKQRRFVAALYAFAAEIATIRGRAREPAAGEIRLQWWADALTGDGHGDVARNPLAAELLATVAEYALPVAPLERAIAARRFDLYDDPMPDLTSFEGYAGETVSAFLQLAAMVLNGGRPVETGDAAGHLGVAQTLAGHLRAFGFNASRGRLMLPLSVFAAHGVTEGDLFTGVSSPGLSAALGQLIELAREHADKAAAAARSLPRALWPVFAPVALVAPALATVAPEVPFAGQPDVPDWLKIVRLARWSLIGR